MANIEIVGSSTADQDGIAAALKLGRHFGEHASAGALQTAYPAASYPGARATVGGVLYEARAGAWSLVQGAGINGTTGAADNALLRADGTGGSTAQATGIIIGDSDEVSGARAKLLTITTSGNLTLDWSAPHVSVTLDAVRQIDAPSTPGAVGAEIMLMLDCAGFTPTWGSGFAHKGGTPPTLTTTTGVVNVFSVAWSPSLSKALLIYAGAWS